MAGAQPSSYRSLFKELEILLVPCQSILSLMNLINSNHKNSSIHNINTKNKHHLHRLNAKLSCFQKSIFYAGIKIFNNLLPSLTVI